MFADETPRVKASSPPSPHLTREIIGAFFDVQNEIGTGFLESVYTGSLRIALKDRGLSFACEVPLAVRFRGHIVGSYRADIVVEGCILVEVKTVTKLDAAHRAQVLNYLRATELELALLCNFGQSLAFERLLWSNARKETRRLR